MKKFLIIVLSIFIIFFTTNVRAFANEPENKPERIQEAFVVALLESIREHTYWNENYKFQQWDCTNMSAVLSTVLTNFGIENKIVCGHNCFCCSPYWHAMVKAKLDGEWQMIEPTWPEIVTDKQLKEWNWQPWTEGYSLEEAQRYYGGEFTIPKLKIYQKVN